MDDDWKPPTAEEMKLIEACRARSDQISKLMSSYLLKGYKMLGSQCTICATILLQDRSGVKHCVACEELQCDTEKDNPALRPPGAPSQSIKDEIRASTAASQTNILAASASSSRRRAGTHSSRTNNDPHHLRAAPEEDGATAECLSMSSIDVHCWPATMVDLGGARDAGGDHAKANKTSPRPSTNSDAAGAAPFPTQGLPVAQPLPSTQDIASCVSVLQAKICWASQALEQNKCVDSSTELCKLIKAAAEAIVAVRKAST
ncbi:sjoegren syndrome/scleroderma autoantigen 1 [Elysia marginata]|uniref:Sjoegren syndrome/scleroderma autoantigen 1 n=1 Tax=Elysia marginata TaxID=1093978 RepID=A0AAV4I2B4_9GAST|nr:sjoegren syndrome/scleroderma autoantigen 1 [Elysia marginata]